MRPLAPVLRPTLGRPIVPGGGGGAVLRPLFDRVYQELFGAGEQGVYMPSVHESFLRGDLYQTSSGDTPVTALGQSVGLWLDRSRGLELGENDAADPNCENLTGSGWFRGSGYALGITQEAGGIRLERPPSGSDIYIRPLKSSDGTQFIAGTYVEIEIEIADVVAGGIRIELVAGHSNANLTINTPGTHILRRRLGNNLTFVPGVNTGDAATIRRVSVREIPGNHASQLTAAYRPSLQARVNMLHATDAPHTSPWNAYQSGTAIAPTVTAGHEAPDGTFTATKVSLDHGAGYTSIDRAIWRLPGVGVVSGETYTSSVWVKAASPADIGKTVRVGLEIGVVLVVELPSEWTRVQSTVESAYTSAVSFIFECRANYTQQAAEFLFWRPQAELGPIATPYQRVTDATDYADVGAPRKIDFDDVDDKLTVTFASALGSDCTIGLSVPGSGASILTGQTIGTSYDIDTDTCGVVIVDRALTSAETAMLTELLNKAARAF